MAVVEEEIAGDSDAEGYLSCWGYGYLDWFGWYFVGGGYGYLDWFGWYFVVGGPGYLDRGGFGLADDFSEEVAA